VPEDERRVEALSPPATGSLLSLGEIEVKGRMPWSSNATFLVSLHLDEATCDAIYKPVRGERPLWDFPSGLYRREVAAYLLDVTLGWGHVPETIVRHDAPMGVGSLQLFVEADFSEHYFTLLEHEQHHEQLRTIAVFDMVANNADRKSGHCLLGEDGWIWAIDHGVCFSDDPKLRTVIWDFAGEPIADQLQADVARARDALPTELCDLLDGAELEALDRRMGAVMKLGRFPEPRGGHPYPWPLV